MSIKPPLALVGMASRECASGRMGWAKITRLQPESQNLTRRRIVQNEGAVAGEVCQRQTLRVWPVNLFISSCERQGKEARCVRAQQASQCHCQGQILPDLGWATGTGWTFQVKMERTETCVAVFPSLHSSLELPRKLFRKSILWHRDYTFKK